MIDIFIVFAYLAALLGIGIWQRSSKHSFKDFARVRDSVNKNKLMLVATIFASSIGGGTAFGLAEKAFESTAAHSYGLLLAIPTDILIAIYAVPRLVKHYGAETVGDIMAKYYGNVGRYITGISSVLVSVGFLAAQIAVSARIFEYILQINYLVGAVISYSIVIAYSTMGGLRSVLFANQLQFFAILIAIPIISIFGIHKLGIDNFILQVPQEKIDFLNNTDLFYASISAFLGFSVMNLFPNFIQRAMINLNPKETRDAIFIKSSIYAIFIVLITINGLLAFAIYPEYPASLALPILIDEIIPAGLQGVVIVGLLSAVMSTADSDLNVTSVSLVKDFLKPLFNIENQQTLLKIAQVTNILVGTGAIYLALSFGSIVDIVIFSAGFWGPITLVPLAFALFDKTISIRAYILATIVGASSFLIWECCFSTATSLKPVFVGTMANFVIFIISFFGKKYAKQVRNYF